MTFIQRLIDADVTLYKRHAPAGAVLEALAISNLADLFSPII